MAKSERAIREQISKVVRAEMEEHFEARVAKLEAEFAKLTTKLSKPDSLHSSFRQQFE